MDETGMTAAEKIALIEEMRETFGDEAAEEVAERYGIDSTLIASMPGGHVRHTQLELGPPWLR